MIWGKTDFPFFRVDTWKQKWYKSVSMNSEYLEGKIRQCIFFYGSFLSNYIVNCLVSN